MAQSDTDTDSSNSISDTESGRPILLRLKHTQNDHIGAAFRP